MRKVANKIRQENTIMSITEGIQEGRFSLSGIRSGVTDKALRENLNLITTLNEWICNTLKF